MSVLRRWMALMLCTLGCSAGRPAVSRRGASSPLAAPRVVPGEPEALALLGDLPAWASKLGAGPVSLVASGESVERERLGAFVFVPAETCLLAYARASSSIDDLDVAAFTDGGSPIVSDDGPDTHPTILLCPPHPERVYVAAVTASGEGFVSIAAQLVPPARAANVGRALGARGARFTAERTADAWAGLDDRVRAHRESLGGKWEEFRRVALAVDARVPAYLNFPLEADTCTDAVIVPDDDVALLDVEAIDAGGRVVARATGDSRDRALTLCSTVTSGGSLSIRPHVGQGIAAVVLGRARGEAAGDLSARPDVAWASGATPLDGARSVRNVQLARAGYGPPQTTRAGALTIGHAFLVPLELGSNDGCSRIDVVAGAPLALVQATVWSDKGALLTRGEGGASVTLFACERGKAHLELEARGRAGPYALLVRREAWADPAFARYPLAASRMLARSAVGPSSVFEGVPIAVQTALLDSAHLREWEEIVPAGKCLRISAGAEGEGTGIMARALDSSTGEEIDRSHADRAIGMRVCATASMARTVRVEVQASAGKLDAVIGERMTE